VDLKDPITVISSAKNRSASTEENEKTVSFSLFTSEHQLARII
jgi:hypothetical protein